MKHYDDDGTLEFFAKGDTGLIACSKGHYWTFPVEEHEAPTMPPRGMGERFDVDMGPLTDFGPGVLEAMRAPDEG